MAHRFVVIEIFLAFLKLGFIAFGGPVAHVGFFHREFVTRRKWLTEVQFVQLLAVCQLLPGPASSQLGFTLGLVRGGWLGAISAFLAFTAPSALLLFGFSVALPWLSGAIGQALLHGLKIVAFAVVADAVIVMAKKLCPDTTRAGIAIVTVVALLIFGDGGFALLSASLSAMPLFSLPIVLISTAALVGYLMCKDDAPADHQPLQALPLGYGKRVGALLLSLFGALLVVLPLLASLNGGLLAFMDIFYRAGALVFGGGHVVLPLLEESVVSAGLLPQEVFVAGYGASQAIPGPIFTFAAYLGALMPSGVNAGIAALIALIAIFLPGFLLVSGVLPFWQSFGRKAGFRRAVAGMSAGVVGLLAAALYSPVASTAILGPLDLMVGLAALAMLRLYQFPVYLVIIGCLVASVAMLLF